MQHDPERLADTNSWLRKASNDLRCAEIDLAAAPPAIEDAVFHAQQALKAFLVWHDAAFAKTHDIGKLGTTAVQFDETLVSAIERVVDLSKYAWLFRYPGEPNEPTTDEAQGILHRARSFVEELGSRIGRSSTAL